MHFYHYSSTVASGLVSTALQCGIDVCHTDDLQLTTPVVIMISHSEELRKNLMEDDTMTTTCVFWQLLSVEGYT